jgi:hypothetical protein
MVTDIAGPMHDGSPKAKVFISYSRNDAVFADRLAESLKEHGFTALIDRSEIYAFEDWWKRIETLIVQADTIVFVLSPDAVSSDICQKEVAFAAALNKRIAPVVCKRAEIATVPEPLRRLNFIFFTEDAPFSERMDQLSEALSTDIEWVRKHTEFGGNARRWGEAGRPGPLGLLLRPPVLEEAELWIASRPYGAPAPTAETRVFITESRRAATRRRKVLTASLGAGLLVALGLTGIATTQWYKAEQARQAGREQLEEQEVQLTRSRDINFKYADLQKITLRSVEAIRKTIDLLLSKDSKTALTLAQNAEPILKQMHEALPEDTDLQEEISFNHQQIGDALVLQGDNAAAYSAYSAAVATREAMLETDPDNVQWQLADVAALYKLASVGHDPIANLNDALTILKHLADEGLLPDSRKTWISQVEKSLADRQKSLPKP